MHISVHDLQYPTIMLLASACFFVIGLGARKVKEKEQAGILLIISSAILFAEFILALGVHVFDITSASKDTIRQIRLVGGGVLLGFFVVMIVFGHFKLLKKK